MAFEDILYEKKENFAKITINRPQVMNAFRTHTLKEMAEALEQTDLDDEVRALIITGAGERAFCAGGDFSEIKEGFGYAKEMDYWHTKVHMAIRNLSKPVIAAVNGYAIGGGNVLVTLCDLAIAADTAIFGQAGPRVGCRLWSCLSGPYRGREKGKGNLVSLPTVHRPGSPGHGSDKQSGTTYEAQ